MLYTVGAKKVIYLPTENWTRKEKIGFPGSELITWHPDHLSFFLHNKRWGTHVEVEHILQHTCHLLFSFHSLTWFRDALWGLPDAWILSCCSRLNFIYTSWYYPGCTMPEYVRVYHCVLPSMSLWLFLNCLCDIIYCCYWAQREIKIWSSLME